MCVLCTVGPRRRLDCGGAAQPVKACAADCTHYEQGSLVRLTRTPRAPTVRQGWLNSRHTSQHFSLITLSQSAALRPKAMADPGIWGPTCWRLVFAASFRLPRARCAVMFDALRYILPCVHCRRSYRTYLQRMPPEAALSDARDAYACAKFAWSIKDAVVKKLGGSVLPFSVLCARHLAFENGGVSKPDVVDFLCCVATQVADAAQAAAYWRFAATMEDLLRVCGHDNDLQLAMYRGAGETESGKAAVTRHALQLKASTDAQFGNAHTPATVAQLSSRFTIPATTVSTANNVAASSKTSSTSRPQKQTQRGGRPNQNPRTTRRVRS